MTDAHRYILSESARDLEAVRLGLLEGLYDPATFARLDALGVAAGWQCLDVGAGRGSVTRWLSSRVGHHGRVMAADLDCRYLTALPDNVEVRPLDISADDLEPASYDLVHCRALLMHLPDPAAAVRRMVMALRPGGLLVAGEPDYGLLNFAGHPDSQWCTDLSRRVFDALARAKVVNSYIGRALPGLLTDAGLELGGADIASSVTRPGEPAADFHRLTMAAAAPRLITAGLATQPELDRLDEVLRSPATVLTPATGITAWAHRAS